MTVNINRNLPPKPPKGYMIIKDSQIQLGDLIWNLFSSCWDEANETLISANRYMSEYLIIARRDLLGDLTENNSVNLVKFDDLFTSTTGVFKNCIFVSKDDIFFSITTFECGEGNIWCACNVIDDQGIKCNSLGIVFENIVNAENITMIRDFVKELGLLKMKLN